MEYKLVTILIEFATKKLQDSTCKGPEYREALINFIQAAQRLIRFW